MEYVGITKLFCVRFVAGRFNKPCKLHVRDGACIHVERIEHNFTHGAFAIVRIADPILGAHEKGTARQAYHVFVRTGGNAFEWLALVAVFASAPFFARCTAVCIAHI